MYSEGVQLMYTVKVPSEGKLCLKSVLLTNISSLGHLALKFLYNNNIKSGDGKVNANGKTERPPHHNLPSGFKVNHVVPAL